MISNIKAGKLIKKAMYLYHLEQMTELDLYSGTAVKFSQEFENSMENLLNSHAEKQVRLIKRKRFAKVAIALTLAFMMLTAFCAREEIARFFVKIFDDRTYVSIKGEGPIAIETKYVPKIIPEGYVLERTSGGEAIKVTEWINETDSILFFQACKPLQMYVDESRTCTKTMVDDILIYCLENEYVKFIIWAYEGYAFKLHCPGNVDWETIVQIVKSVEAVN